jgi:hypothetical protein
MFLKAHDADLFVTSFGTGATLNRAATITFELLVNDLFRVLDALAIETCVLACESCFREISIVRSTCYHYWLRALTTESDRK